MISLIAALNQNRVIGAGGRIPWRLSPDLRRFKALTMGRPIVMGRRTHESIGRALPGRTNIVITHQRDYAAEGCVVARSVEEALRLAGDGEAFVIGGGELYAQTIGVADRLYLTMVEIDVPNGDAFFPEIEPAQWVITSQEQWQLDPASGLRYQYVTHERVSRANDARGA